MLYQVFCSVFPQLLRQFYHLLEVIKTIFLLSFFCQRQRRKNYVPDLAVIELLVEFLNPSFDQCRHITRLACKLVMECPEDVLVIFQQGLYSEERDELMIGKRRQRF